MQKRKKGRKVALVAGLALVVLSVAMVWTYWGEIQSWYDFRHRDFESLGRNEQGYPEYRHRGTGIVFVGLPGGTFEMGRSPGNEALRSDYEGPVHKVTLSPFLIAKYEVTQAQWKAVMGNNPSDYGGRALPVHNVSWEDCQDFCEKTGFSLPTEAQWEHACRAGTSGAYAGTGTLDDMGWYRKPGGRLTNTVGQKLPNDFGLHDMHGNVFEWCEDWYQADFYQESAGARDPLCENSGSGWRVLRGGSYRGFHRACRSAWRGNLSQSVKHKWIGLRPSWSSP